MCQRVRVVDDISFNKFYFLIFEFSCSEGAASNITVTLLSGTGATAVQTVEKIIIPDGDNGMMYLAAYAEDGVPDFRTITGSNVAVLKLSKALTLAAWPGKIE